MMNMHSDSFGLEGYNLRPTSAKMNLMQRISTKPPNSSKPGQRSRPPPTRVTSNMRPISAKCNTYTQKFQVGEPKRVEFAPLNGRPLSSDRFRPRPRLIATQPCQLVRRSVEGTIGDEDSNCLTQVFDAKLLSRKLNTECNITRSRQELPRRPRRVQSAKARTISDPEEPLISKLNNYKKKRPVSAIELGSMNRWNYAFHRDLKPATSDNNLINGKDKIPKTPTLSNSQKFKEPDLSGPSVFGYKSHSYVSGPVPVWRQGQSVTCQYKLDPQAANMGKGTREDDELSLSELIDFEDTDELDQSTRFTDRNLKRPHKAWTHTDTQQEVAEFPAKCFIVLPTKTFNIDNLPERPLPEKPYLTDRKHWKPKKYDHPWNPLPIKEPECERKNKSGLLDINTEVVPPETPRQIKVYAIDGRLLHQTIDGFRTEEVVRKEIQELEDLMLGIGTLNGCSMVVQYQAELNRLHNMVTRTMGRVEEIERREEEKRRLAEPPDTFGLRKYYKSHDEIMVNLRAQHELCIQELVALTGDLELNTARDHFIARLEDMDGEKDEEKCGDQEEKCVEIGSKKCVKWENCDEVQFDRQENLESEGVEENDDLGAKE